MIKSHLRRSCVHGKVIKIIRWKQDLNLCGETPSDMFTIVQITRLNDSAIPASESLGNRTFKSAICFHALELCEFLTLRSFVDIRCLEQHLRANGFPDPFHNLGISGGLCGQYVCPKSNTTPRPEHNHPPNRHECLFLFHARCCLGKMLVILRDGRKLHGVLRSYDQFGMSWIVCFGRLFCTPFCPTANLVLEDTVERIYHENVFAESWRGLYLIRGENVVLLGEIGRWGTYSIPLDVAYCLNRILTWKMTFHYDK